MQQHPHDHASNWLKQSERDYGAAAYLVEGARYDAACFCCQQAAEKALKAALIWLAGDRPRTREIDVLVAEVARYRDDAIDALGDIDALGPYYVTTRYPDAIGGGVPGSKFYKPEAALCLERAARAIAYVAELLAQAKG